MNATVWIRACALVACVSMVVACGKTDPAVHVQSAKAYLTKGEYNAAVIELKNALNLTPDNGEARHLLAKAFLLAGDSAGAVTESRKALDLKYSPDEACIVLGAALLQQRQLRQVTGELPKCDISAPKARAEADATLAAAYLGLGDAKQARVFVDKALAQQADNVRARVANAQLVAMQGDLEGSLKLVDSLLAQVPSDVDALMLKAELERATGRSDDALRTLTHVVKIKPNLAAPRVALVLTLLRANELDKAAAEVEAIKKVAPSDPQVQYMDALVLLSRRNYPAARDAIQKSRQAAPDSLPAQFVAGLIDYRLGNLQTAEDSFRTVVSKAPLHDGARRALASLYVRRGRPQQALDVLEPALKRAPDNPATLSSMGEVYLAFNNPAKAAEYLDRANAVTKGDVPSRIRVAHVRMAAGDVERGLQELEDLSASQPDNQAADVALITALLRKREFDKAVTAATAFEQKQPKNPVGPNIKGVVYLGKGDVANARTSFEKALALDPGFAAATYNLARLDTMVGNLGEARKRYDQLLAKDPKNEQYVLSLAEAMAALNAPSAEVIAVINRAVTANPASVRARLTLVRYHGSRRDWQAALSAAQAAQAAIPDNPAVLETLGRTQIAAGQTNSGVETLRQAVRLQPGVVAPLVRLAEAQAQTKDYDGALATLRSALDIQRDSLELWSALAGVYARAGRTEEGLSEAKRLKKNASRAEGWLVEGDLLALQSKWAEAVGAYKAAAEKRPSTFTIARLQATQFAAKQTREAQATAQRWLKEHPEDLAVRLRLGEQLILTKDYQAGIAQLKIAANAAPNHVEVLNNLAWAMGEVGDPKAVETAARAHALAPNSPEVTDTYGWVLVQHGDIKQGVELLRKGVALSPDDPQKRLRLARALIKGGDKAAAKVELEAVIAKSGNQPTARADAEKLLKEI